METGRSEGKQSSTNAVDDRDMTINSLITGMTYVIRMYAVSAGDISSRATSYLTATVGKCTDIIYLTTQSVDEPSFKKHVKCVLPSACSLCLLGWATWAIAL